MAQARLEGAAAPPICPTHHLSHLPEVRHSARARRVEPTRSAAKLTALRDGPAYAYAACLAAGRIDLVIEAGLHSYDILRATIA